jgi:hypothetical protein
MELKEPAFNIKYVITGREDGRWVIVAYDRQNNPIGHRIIVSTPGEAWSVFFMLNGTHYGAPIEKMELERAS